MQMRDGEKVSLQVAIHSADSVNWHPLQASLLGSASEPIRKLPPHLRMRFPQIDRSL
jgi:hypothetical protein